MRLVIFDFDGTIYRGETARLFLRVLKKNAERRRAVRRYYLRQAFPYLLYRLGLRPWGMVARGTLRLAKIFKGMTETELCLYLRQCLAAAKPGFHAAALARLQEHLDAGDKAVLLSGTFTCFLALVAGELGIGYLPGNDLEIAPDGRCSGGIRNHGIGPAKARILTSFLAEQESAGVRFDLKDAYAYADGFQDLPVLSLVGHPVVVNPDSRLRKIAESKGWEII